MSHQGQSKISTSLQILCSPYSLLAGGLHSTECVLVFFLWQLRVFNMSRFLNLSSGSGGGGKGAIPSPTESLFGIVHLSIYQ